MQTNVKKKNSNGFLFGVSLLQICELKIKKFQKASKTAVEQEKINPKKG